MKIVCAPDSFKETLSAMEVAEAMALGIRRFDPSIECDCCPVADGGEGTMEAIIGAVGGKVHTATVTGPIGDPVEARFGILTDGKTGVVELAEASGLALLPIAKRNPLKTTTYGTGELISLARARGCESVIVCIGGSATVDGATGIAQALGATFYDEGGRVIREPMCGGMLHGLSRYEPPQTKNLPRIRIACDVTNPLCGPNGAANVYGPQKGATPDHVNLLDQSLAHLAKIVGGDPNQPGAGSSGGAGFGLVEMCGGTLERGIDLVLDIVQFNSRCQNAKLVLTGEGRLDGQSLHGKSCIGVANAAMKLGVPTIAIVGSTGTGVEDCLDPSKGGTISEYNSLADRFGIDRAMREPKKLIEFVAAEIAQKLK